MSWVAKAHELQTANVPHAIVTMIGTKGSTPRELGAKMIVWGSHLFGTVGGGALEARAIQEANALLNQGAEGTHRIALSLKNDLGMVCGGEAEILIEVMGLAPDVYIFGAGHVGLALSSVLADAPFRVHLIDERGEWIDSPRIHPSVVRHSSGINTFIEKATWSKNKTYVAIMTPGHRLDQTALEGALRKDTCYIGMIGSQTKWANVKADMRAKGFTDEDFSRVHCPIGLSIGGKTPAEVAVSVAAEIIQYKNRTV